MRKSWRLAARLLPIIAMLRLVRLLATLWLAIGAVQASATVGLCSLLPGAGLNVVKIHTEAGKRAINIYVPAVLSGKRQALIFDLHGSGSNGEQQAINSRLRAIADREGFILANPDGDAVIAGRQNAFAWNIPGVSLMNGAAVPDGTADDLVFIRDTIDQLVAAKCVDRRRVYSTGFSGGARMSSYLGCALADRIAAIAPVAGLRAGLPSRDNPTVPDTASCQPTRPMPIISFHNKADPVNPYGPGGTPYWQYSVPTALERWVALDRCKMEPMQSVVSDKVTRLHYGNCSKQAEITLYLTDAPVIDGGGHVWPRAHGVDASNLIAAFFKQHRLPR